MTTFRNLEAILFDFGGTLDAPGIHWLNRFYRLYPEAGLRVAPVRIKDAFYWADRAILDHPRVTSLTLRPLMYAHVSLQLRYLGLPARPYQERLAEGFSAAAMTALQTSVQVCRALHGPYALGIISNFYGNVAVLCHECGLAPLCRVIIDSAQVGVSKPDLRIFRLALQRLGCAPERAAYVGDSVARDMIPARQAGMRTIWLRGEAPRPCSDPSAVDAWISTLDMLPARLAMAGSTRGTMA